MSKMREVRCYVKGGPDDPEVKRYMAVKNRLYAKAMEPIDDFIDSAQFEKLTAGTMCKPAVDDWEIVAQRPATTTVEGRTVACLQLTVMWRVTPDDDLGVTEEITDSTVVTVYRNPNNPNQLRCKL